MSNLITYNGETHSVIEWKRRLNLPHSKETLYARLRRGWSAERAFTLPPDHRHCQQSHRNHEFDFSIELEAHGKRMTIAAWAEKLGVTDALLRGRLDKGWSLERVCQPLLRCRRKA